MNRLYISTADFNAPFDGAQYLSGLGMTGNAARTWPQGRSYWSTANFRAPYDEGYFQDNTLMGIKEDVSVVMRQIPTWAYALGGAGLAWLAYKGYNRKRGKKTK